MDALIEAFARMREREVGSREDFIDWQAEMDRWVLTQDDEYLIDPLERRTLNVFGHLIPDPKGA